MDLPRHIPRDLRPLAESAVEQGWNLRLTSKGHLRWQSPKGEIVISAGTPGDLRSIRNTRSQLRRAGLAIND